MSDDESLSGGVMSSSNCFLIWPALRSRRLILEALAVSDLQGLRSAEILPRIRKIHGDYPAANLTLYLKQLCSGERGHVFRVDTDGKYRFSEPIFKTYAQVMLGLTSTSNLSRTTVSLLSDALKSLTDTFFHNNVYD
jgi:hypothetical protein